MSSLDQEFKKIRAKREGQVRVDISYDIIRQFSSQLYTNPRKAIEELVCNSYDAGATECHVRIPKDKTEALVVLDNGKSMDFSGLQDLWRVAKSPKAQITGQRVANGRLQIGKFGVGKLAAYALGKRLTHVATIKNVTRVVSVSEGDLKDQKRGAPKFNVYKAKESQVRALLEPLLGSLPRPWDEGWDSWTIAVVDDVSEGNFQRALKMGILRRMITTALPIFKHFKVALDGELIKPNTIEQDDIEVTVDVLKPEFRKKLETELQQYWAEQRDEKPIDVPDELFKIEVVDMDDPKDVAKTLKAINVPKLGPVEGRAILANRTLTTDKLGERGYVNHGFHIFSHGKLVNPEDELFGVPPRSHAYWRRFQARVEIPGLDDVLLVQRNAVSENSTKAQLAREVMRVLFNYTRSQAEEKEQAEEFVPPVFGAKIRTVSPLLAPLALEGLSGGNPPKGGLSEVDIDFVSLGEDGPAAQYDQKSHTIQINDDHPIISALDELGENAQKQWRRVMGELVAGCKLGEGLLLAKDVEAEIVMDNSELIDAALRSAASFIRDPVQQHIQEIEEASYEGSTRFENAVANAFRSLGLAARRIGGADNPDGIVEIPVSGVQNRKISIEAKGTKGVISHTELSQSTMARHQKEYGCTSAIAIARDYQTEGIGGKHSALVREADAAQIPLLTVKGIAKMLRLHAQRPFTYDKVIAILTTPKHPDDLEEFIEEQWRDLPELGLMRAVLEAAHQIISDDDKNLPDPGMVIRDVQLKKSHVTKEQVRNILDAVAVTTGMIVIKNRDNYEFDMKASVATILQAMTAASKEAIEEPVKADGKVDSTKKK